jgi:CHAD domain-containing protein
LSPRAKVLGLDAENRCVELPHDLTGEAGYDTLDGDLRKLGIALARSPLEAGVVWRLALPRGERVEAWEPGTAGLAPPAEILTLIDAVVADKELVPLPPPTRDPGARRLRELLEAQRRALRAHDPGTRLGADPENLHQHRVAARRTRAFLRATRDHVDADWRRSLSGPLGELGEASGPVRDLDVLLEHVRSERDTVDDEGTEKLLEILERERQEARQTLLAALDGPSHHALLTRLRMPPRLAEGVESIPLRRIARKEFRRLMDAVDALGKHPDDARLHKLRIALKRARYAAELAEIPGSAGRRFLADAKALQTLLGEHQDAAVAERHLRSSTVVDGPTAAAFVAGRIAERQHARRSRIRERLPAAWKRLRKSGTRLG